MSVNAVNATLFGGDVMMDDRIVAIETSSAVGSVALAVGPRLVEEQTFPAATEHARELLPALDALCRRHGWVPSSIRQTYVSIGPGSFTGLRVAVAFARHLSLAVGVRICAVPTLDVIAANVAETLVPPGNLAVILDAKQGQVYGAVYSWAGSGYRCEIGPVLLPAASLFQAAEKPFSVVGAGVEAHGAAIDAAGAARLPATDWLPRASVVHRLGWRMAELEAFTPANELIPRYIRRPEAEEVWERRHGVKS